MTATVNIAGLTAAISAVNAAISAVGTLETASPVILGTVYNAVQNARQPFDAAVASLDSGINSVIGGVVAGVPAPISAAALIAQQQTVEQEAIILVAEAYLVRTGVNVLNSPG